MDRPLTIAGAVALALLSSCAKQTPGGNDADLYQANTAILTPGVQPVLVGEGGPAYPACASSGTVVNLSPAGERYLPLRAAPFAEADETAQLGEGRTLFLCSRSLDQRWQGVVVPPAPATPANPATTGVPAVDCGVTATLASARPYAGPCRSGWVSSSFVRPSAG